jgi:hypothetical protein
MVHFYLLCTRLKILLFTRLILTVVLSLIKLIIPLKPLIMISKVWLGSVIPNQINLNKERWERTLARLMLHNPYESRYHYWHFQRLRVMCVVHIIGLVIYAVAPPVRHSSKRDKQRNGNHRYHTKMRARESRTR